MTTEFTDDSEPVVHPTRAAKLWDRTSKYVVMATVLAVIIFGWALLKQVNENSTNQTNYHKSTQKLETKIFNQGQEIQKLTGGLNSAVTELDTFGAYLITSQTAVCQSTHATCPPVPDLPGIATTP